MTDLNVEVNDQKSGATPQPAVLSQYGRRLSSRFICRRLVPPAFLVAILFICSAYLKNDEIRGHQNRLKSDYIIRTKNYSPQGLPVCSFPILHAAMDNITGYLSAKGTWLNNKQELRFQPSICRYVEYDLPWAKNTLKTCLRKEGVKRIVILGDSNGQRYHGAWIRMLDANNHRCTLVKKEISAGHEIDLSFFGGTETLSQTHLQVRDRRCSTCISEHWTCSTTRALSSPVEHTVDSKYISMNTIHDNQMMTKRSLTTQEYIFQEYLQKDGNVPDLLIVFGNNHDKSRLNLVDFRRSLKNFFELVDAFLPPSSHVVWLSKPSFYMPLAPDFLKNQRLETLTINEWTRKTNDIFYKELKERIERNGRHHAFFDIFELPNQVRPTVMVDFIHSKPVWYDRIISYIFQTLCADEFQ